MASTAGRYILMELDTPWAHNIRESRHFPPPVATLLERAYAREWYLSTRFHCIAPDAEHSRPGHTRFLHLRRPPGPAAGFTKEDYLVPDGAEADLARALVEAPDVEMDAAPTPFAPYRQDTGHVRDLLVCTHGAVDACCARFGYPLYDLLRRRYAAKSGGRLRAWRVSHFGGHRLAPTLIDFPEGRYWGHLNAAALERLVRRAEPLADLRPHYRGWGGLANRFEQVLEREAFIAEGWAWTAYRKTARTVRVSADETQAEVEIAFASPHGDGRGMYGGIVEASGAVPYVHCLEPGHQGEMKQYRVVQLEKIIPAIPAATPAVERRPPGDRGARERPGRA